MGQSAAVAALLASSSCSQPHVSKEDP